MKKVTAFILTKTTCDDDFTEKVPCFRKGKRLLFDWQSKDFKSLDIDSYLKKQTGYFFTEEEYELLKSKNAELESQIASLLEKKP